MTNEEKKSTNAEFGGSAPRCRMGRKTDRPCWRAAVEPRFADEEEPTLCAEHARLVGLSDEMEDWYRTLFTITEWIEGPVRKARDEDLERLAFNARDEARREYGSLAVRAYAANLVAEQGPPEPGEVPLFFEQEEELARLIMRADALNDARRVLEDLDEDSLKLRDKWATIDALATSAADASEEVSRYRKEIGLRSE
ncbi:MAG: hypothetical protein H0T57_17605 [Rubrobacter sp.]|nr:hypothetical protein [Rubrobacter sp.]